jgi:hypothetical protein
MPSNPVTTESLGGSESATSATRSTAADIALELFEF